jgi:exopolysaccharide biosynthesis polyprenyl glycosylphosphotransferase
LSDTITQKITFLGDDKFCSDAYAFLDRHKTPYRAVAIVDHDTKDVDSLRDWAIEQNVDEIIYDGATCEQSDDQLLSCLDEGIKISAYSDFIEDNFSFVPVEYIDAKWLLGASVEVAHPYYNGIKRLLDVVVAGTGLVVASPILLLAMVLIKLSSPGPAIYSQERIGRFKRRFRIFKLRSMVQNAEVNGAQWASAEDARVTWIGRILRRTRIDELPQFWNVLRGDMSLVGPRPERPEFVDLLSEHIPFYLQRHLVKPGLTGWAQIHYPYGASIDDAHNKLKYDLYYVKRASLLLDLQIALRTLGTIMSGSR